MKFLIIFTLILGNILFAQELKIIAKNMDIDEKAGITIFKGDVNIIKGSDELNASAVTVYTDKEHQPKKFIAEGKASFYIVTEKKSIYRGKANKVIYLPTEKEYYFYKNVHLEQIDEKKEIIGDEVVLKTIDGTAYAKGATKEPVIMIFNLKEKEE